MRSATVQVMPDRTDAADDAVVRRLWKLGRFLPVWSVLVMVGALGLGSLSQS
jgi:hypothetical protein